ncbi:MAG: restriction endonuclease subunit S [Parasporobacterium sp.]|nr:restriction endonuclease subunit S [Parasporobacterium sp.]
MNDIFYEKTKHTNEKWLGDIPESWSAVRLKNIFSIKKNIAGEEGHTVLSVTQRGIRPKVMTDKGQFAQDYSKYQLVERGDFVMNHMDLLTGWVDISAYDGVTSPDYRVFVNSNPAKFESRYYRYIFQLCYSARIFYGLGQGVAGFGRWRLPADMFLNFRLPVPSLKEQVKIADFLDDQVSQIDSIIEEAKSSIEEYKQWKASVIFEAVTKGLKRGLALRDSHEIRLGLIPAHWRVAKVKHVAKLNPSVDVAGLTPDTEVSFAPMECIRTDKRVERTATYSDNNSSYSSFNNGDIALAKVTPCFQNSNVCIMSDLQNGYAFGSSELFNIRPFAINTRYLLYYLITEAFKDGGVASMTGVAGLQRVSSVYVRNAVLPLPPEAEQAQIVDYLDNKIRDINELIDEKSELVEDLESYKRSLIYETVTGKRKVV